MARPQLGLNPADCAGYTTAQLSQIDFSRLDFSEFLQSLQGKAVAGLPARDQLAASYTKLMGSANGGSAQIGTMANGSNVVGDTHAKTAAPANVNLPTYPGP